MKDKVVDIDGSFPHSDKIIEILDKIKGDKSFWKDFTENLEDQYPELMAHIKFRELTLIRAFLNIAKDLQEAMKGDIISIISNIESDQDEKKDNKDIH